MQYFHLILVYKSQAPVYGQYVVLIDMVGFNCGGCPIQQRCYFNFVAVQSKCASTVQIEMK